MRAAGLVVLCLVLASGHGALHFKSGAVHFKSGIHSDLCAWGSQYWCSSTKTAQRCGKTAFCTTRVWPLKLIQDTQCQVTQQVVKHSRQLLESRIYKMSSYHDMAIVIAKACGNFEDEKSRLQCKAIVTDDNILPKLLKLIATRLPTESVALAIGGCHRQEPLVMQKCHTCEDFTRSIQNYVSKTLSKDAYLRLFRPACDKVGQGSKACMLAISSRYQAFRHGLAEAQPNQVCAGKSLCLKKNIFSDAENFDSCSVCKDVVQAIRDLDRNQEVQSIVKDLMKSACTYLGGFKELCDLLADEGLTYVFEIIASEMEPIVVCEKLELCSSVLQNSISEPKMTQKEEGSLDCIICQSLVTEIETFITSKGASEEVEKVLKTFCSKQPSSLYQECSNFIDQFGPMIIRLIVSAVPPKRVCKFINVCKDKVELKETPQDSAGCALCEFVMKEVDTLIESNNTEQALKQALDTVCKKLPGTITAACEDLVTTYSPMIIALIVNKLDPKLVCTTLGLCKNNSVQRKETPQDAAGCALCEFVMKEIDTLITSNNTEQALEQALDTVCKKLPGTITAACEDLVTTYSPMIIALIVNKLDPKLVCTTLGLCKSNSVQRKETPQDAAGCALCEFVMKEIDTLITSNNTEQALEQALDTVCKKLPGTITAACEDLVTTYSPMIIALIVNKLDPKLVCTTLGLCKNNSVLRKEAPQDAAGCALCEFVMKEIDTLITSNSTEQALEQALDTVCKKLPGTITAACEDLVTTYSPMIIALIVNKLDPKLVCTTLGLCKNNSVQRKETPQDAAGCALCEFVMKEIDTLITSNNTEQALEQALDTVCKKLPGTITAACEDLVTTYSPMIIALIVNKLDPKLVCTTLGLCKNNSVFMTKHKFKLSTKGAEKCDLCEFVMNKLESILQESSTEAEIKAGLERVCQLLPSTIRGECSDLVNKYADFVIQLLVQEVQPQKICQVLGLCSSTSPKSKGISTPSVGKQKTEICALCITLMQYAEKYLDQSSTEDKIVAVLDKVCNVLPESDKQLCTQLLPMLVNYVVQMFEQQVAPEDICKAIKLCSHDMVNSSKLLKKLSFVTTVKEGEQCVLCKFVLGEVDELLEKNATKEDITAALEKVCDILPTQIKDQCIPFVQLYAPYVIDLLVQDLVPSEVCNKLGLCNNTASKLPKKLPVGTTVKQGELCTLCKFVMGELDNLLETNATKEDITAALEKVCDILPTQIKAQCIPFVQLYAPYVIDLLVQDLVPSEVCNKLGLCNNTGKVQELKMPKATSGELCTVCEFVMNYVDQILKENGTQQEIKQVLEEVCGVLPSSLKAECNALIEQYFDLIIQVFEQLSPQEICASLGLCQNKGKVQELKMPKATSGELCTVCEFVMNYVDQILKENGTQQEIKQVLEEVCGVLPSSLKAECNSLIEQYFDLIIQVFEQLSPQEICTTLGLCQNKGKVQELKMPKATSGELCTVCEFVMNYVDQILKENGTQQEIKQVLEEVCGVLPSSLKAECNSLIEQYFDLIIQVFEQLSPQEICTTLGLCQNKGKVQELKMPKATSGELCTVCEFVMNYVDQILKENGTQQEIKQVLEEVCGVLPSSLKAECNSLIEQYFDLIIQVFEQLSPQEICTTLGLCQNKGKVQELKMPKATSGELCTVCEFVMNYVDQILKENGTQQEIKQVLEEVCGVLPASLKAECNSLIEQYFDLIIQVFEQLSPQEICTTLGLCQNKVQNPLKTFSANVKVKSGELCPICMSVFTALDNFLEKNSTEEAVIAALDKVCDVLPDQIKEKCIPFVALYTPLVVDLIVEGLSPKQICDKIGICTNKVNDLKSYGSIKDSQLCDFCEEVFTTLDSILKENSTQAQIESALERVCDIIPSSMKQECIQLIETFTPQIIQLVLQRIQPKQICVSLGLCPSIAGKGVTQTKGVECVVCEYAMAKLESMITTNSSESEISNALKAVCGLLPSAMKENCDDFIEKYSKFILQFLMQEMRPRQVCIALGLCSNQAIYGSPENATPRKNNVQSDELCIICETVITELDNILSSPSTEAQIEAALDKVCNYLPSTIRSDCITFVELYAPQVIDLLVKSLDAKRVCTFIRLCTNTAMTQANLVKPKSASTSSPSCFLCEIVVGKLKTMITSQATEAEIEAALEKVCGYLPSEYKEECDEFVQKYISEIIQLIVDDYSAEEICAKLGLCSSGKESNLVKPKSASTSSPSCFLCEIVVGKLKTMITSQATEAEIEAALEKVCGYLPSEYKEECDEFVQKYISEIIQLILDDYSAEEICAKLGLCSSGKEYKVTLKSVEGCTLCKFVLEELQGVLWSPTNEKEAGEALKEICNEVPSNLQAACSDLVVLLTPHLMEFIGDRIYPKGICEFLELCVKNPPSNSLMVVSKQDSVTTPVPHSVKNCTACKFAMYEIQTALNTPYWQAESTTILLLFCQKIKTWPDVCQYLVKQDLPGLISQIRSFRFPIEFCQELKMCAPEAKVKHSNSLTFVSEQQQMMTPPSPQFVKTCTACKFAGYTSQMALKTPFWQEETQTVLLHLCQKVQTWPDVCQFIITQNLLALIEEIQGFNFPMDFCQELNVCEAPLKESTKFGANGVECEICKVLAEVAGSFLQKNSTVSEAETFLVKVCNTVVPEAERAQCISITQEYTSVLLQLVAQFMDPKEVCETIKLCPKVPNVYKILRRGGY